MAFHAQLRKRLESKIGQKVKITFHHHQQTITVLSVDADGLLCRTVAAQPGEDEEEFWLPFKDVAEIDESLEPPLVS